MFREILNCLKCPKCIQGKITGEVVFPIVNAERKADLLQMLAQQESITTQQIIAIGDGANDLLMLSQGKKRKRKKIFTIITFVKLGQMWIFSRYF